MTDSGRIKQIVGLRVTWMEEGIKIDLQAYIERVLKTYQQFDSKPYTSPIEANFEKVIHADERTLDSDAKTRLQQIVGSLSYWQWWQFQW